jgi:hypothetical protein
MFASPAYADWESVVEDMSGNLYYVDFDRIRKNEGYAFFWFLGDMDIDDDFTDNSVKSYNQGDCEMFRYKTLSSSTHKQPMGEGIGDTNSQSNPKWIYPSPNSVDEIVLNQVCRRIEVVLEYRADGLHYETGKITPYTGKYLMFYPNGKVKESSTFKNGKEDGAYKFFHANGRLKQTATFKDGRLDGVAEDFLENGKRNFIGNYKDGRYDGVWQYFHDNGKIKKIYALKDGYRNGLYREFSNEGELVISKIYEDDFVVSCEKGCTEQ